MKNLRWLIQVVILMVALTVGLLLGLGISSVQIKNEQQSCADKIKEANRKIAFMQKKMTEEKAATAIPREQQCSDELDAIERLENEKKTHGIQAGKLKEQMQKLEMQVKESYEVLVRMKKEAKESSEVAAKIKKELQEMERKNKELDNELQKITAEEQTLQVDLKKKTQELGSCMSNNAELCLLAEELVEKYRSKGLGTMILEKEPLTQIKKVKLEQLSQKYLEQIKQKKMDNKRSGGKE